MVDLLVIRSFLMWCSIVNIGLLAIAFLFITLAGDWLHRIHSLWFPIPRDTFNLVAYCFLGLFKILVLVFNVVPYVALLIIL